MQCRLYNKPINYYSKTNLILEFYNFCVVVFFFFFSKNLFSFYKLKIIFLVKYKKLEFSQ